MEAEIPGLLAERGRHEYLFLSSICNGLKKRNAIQGLLNSSGVWVQKEEEMQKVTSDYFADIFQSGHARNPDVVLDCVDPVVSDDMNETLCSPFVDMRSIKHCNKCTRLRHQAQTDSLLFFYQKYWIIAGANITSTVLEVLNGGKIQREWN